MTDEAQRRVLIERMWSVGIEVTAVFAVFSGESCVDIPTARRTVGYLNPALRQKRVEKTEMISDFAKALGVDKVAAHVGFVPEDRSDSDYGPMADTVGHVADYCAQNNQVFCLETGQETEPTLLRFLQDLDRPNVKVNFDPANMIL